MAEIAKHDGTPFEDHDKVLEFFYCIGTGMPPRNTSFIGVICLLTGWDESRAKAAVQRLHDEKLITHPTAAEVVRISPGTT